MTREEIINNLIKKEEVDTNLISDGFHTFSDLYSHRIELFIALARWVNNHSLIPVWRYKDDDKWFLLGIETEKGKQITYHLPMSQWADTEFAYTRSIKPEWDGHTSNDVLERLKQL